MKGLLIASVLLLALVSVSASTEVETAKLRGPENRDLGLINLNLNLNVLDLINVILRVNINDPISVRLCLDAINLLKIKLNLQLLLLGGCSVPVPDCNPNLSCEELIKLCAVVDLNNALSIAACLKVLEVLRVKLNVQVHRNLGLLDLNLNLNLNLNCLDLLHVVLKVNINDPVSVRLCLNALNLLKIKLNLQLILLGGCSVPVPDCNPNLSCAQLLQICANVDLNDPLSIAICLKALEILKIKLSVQVHRNLGWGGDLVNINLNAEVASLVQAILKVNVNDIASVKLCLNVLQLLIVDLDICLPGSINCDNLPNDIDVNITIEGLLAIIAKVDLGNPICVITTINACHLLVVKLLAIVG